MRGRLRREPESNSEGDLVGERALGWFAGTSNAQSPRVGYYSIFWTWDRYYWALTGEHLEDVLALERRLKAEGTNAVWRWHQNVHPSLTSPDGKTGEYVLAEDGRLPD